MAGERLTTMFDEIQFVWTRCCCGVKCYAGLGFNASGALGQMSSSTMMPEWDYVGEYEFVETIEKTALRCQEAALERAKEILKR